MLTPNQAYELPQQLNFVKHCLQQARRPINDFTKMLSWLGNQLRAVSATIIPDRKLGTPFNEHFVGAPLSPQKMCGNLFLDRNFARLIFAIKLPPGQGIQKEYVLSPGIIIKDKTRLSLVRRGTRAGSVFLLDLNHTGAKISTRWRRLGAK